jgi:3-hydroxy-9,10-secoandrosta-1,3,5(10)-triene-9,17-dione monooxygenase reductase component
MDAIDQGHIHDEHPFATPPDLRDPARQLRGRLAAPVTILTAGEGAERTGLTVSSVMVAEGDPPLVYCLLGPETDFTEVIARTGRFVLHVADATTREAADVFAGIRPSPGGLFATRAAEPTAYGPRLSEFHDFALCSVVSSREESYSSLVAATIDHIETTDLVDPLLYFRGAYRRLTEG